MNNINIRPFKTSDSEALCNIFAEVISTGETYDFAPNTPKEKAIEYFTSQGTKCFVAEVDGKVAGMYSLKANRPGLASHIGNCSYMVSSEFRGKGIGQKLCLHSIEQANKDGFKAIQFNFVVSTNTSAIKLWQKCGFEIIGTIPGGYKHTKFGFVDAYIMFKKL